MSFYVIKLEFIKILLRWGVGVCVCVQQGGHIFGRLFPAKGVVLSWFFVPFPLDFVDFMISLTPSINGLWSSDGGKFLLSNYWIFMKLHIFSKFRKINRDFMALFVLSSKIQKLLFPLFQILFVFSLFYDDVMVSNRDKPWMCVAPCVSSQCLRNVATMTFTRLRVDNRGVFRLWPKLPFFYALPVN